MPAPEPEPEPPSPHELRAFLRVAEMLHFGRAAESLGVAQSSLSECIRRLEAKVGAVLFERTSRRVALTDAGATLLPRAGAVMDELAAARAALSGPREGPLEVVRVGVEGLGFDRVLNRRLVDRFRERFPHAELVLYEMHGTPRGFLRSGADVAFVRSPMADPRLRVEALAHIPRGVIVPARHPAADADRADLHRLLDEVFVEIAPQDPVTRDYWAGTEVRGGRPAKVAGEANSTAEVLYAITHLGLLTTGSAAAVDMAGPGALRFLPSDDLSPVRIGIAARADERRGAVLGLVELAVDLAGEAAGAAVA